MKKRKGNGTASMSIELKCTGAQELIHFLENSTENGPKETETIQKLEHIIGQNPQLIQYQAISLFNSGYTKEAINYLEESVKKYQRCFELHSLMFELLRYTTEYQKIFYALSQMYKLAENEQIQQEILKKVEDFVASIKMSKDDFNQYFEYFKAEGTSVDYRSYPLDQYGKSIIRQDAFPDRDKDKSYLVNMYKTMRMLDVNPENRFYFLYEMIQGNFVKKEAYLSVNEGDIVAVSSARKDAVHSNVLIKNLEDDLYRLKLQPHLIKYLKIKKSKDLLIASDQDIFLSHFKRNIIENKPKLVLQIFIDGLSAEFLNQNGFEHLMPRTYEFFSNGYINNNCHANGEWTLPSLMSMCTGKYTTHHHVFHTEASHKGEENSKYIQEYFEEAGYMTGRICSNWRGTPSYGYFKGTKRSVYSPLHDRMNASESVIEAIEHLETFKDFPNYLWLTLEDLHNVADGLTRGPFQDVQIENYFSETIENDSDISVFRSYNEQKIEEYKATMKKVDLYLGILYESIFKNYSDHDFIVTLNSDHGQRFIEEEDYMFTQKRTNVPFMMRGYHTPVMVSDELMSNVDIVPTLLQLCGLECSEPVDGSILKDFGGTARDYTITESIFPGQTYKLAINDTEHSFRFETKENTRSSGMIPAKDYTVQLINRTWKADETDLYQEKVEKYCQEAFEHFKEWIAFDV